MRETSSVQFSTERTPVSSRTRAVPRVVSGDYIYNVNTDGTATITDYTGTGGDLDIPATLDGLTVTRIDRSAFEGSANLFRVEIPDSVTSIGPRAFYDCADLVAVELPDGITSIAEYLFMGCSSLTEVTIPDSVNLIGDSAFDGCSSLTAVTIPGRVSSTGSRAFYGCSSLTDVTLLDGVAVIASNTFSSCSSLQRITIPSSVVTIGFSAFDSCSSLTDVILPNSVAIIGDSAFRECTGLTSVTIPDSVTRIGEAAFYRCRSLTDVTIPGRVSSTGARAFYGCSALTDVTILDGVDYISSETFSGCSSLQHISMGSVGSIGDNAFYGCNSLTDVTLPNSVTTLGSAFTACTNLKSLTAYSTLEAVDPGSFEGVSLDLLTYHGSRAEYYAEGNQLREALNPQPAEIVFDDEETPPPSASDFIYEANEDGTATIVGYTGSGGNLVIPATLGGRRVTAIGGRAFAEHTNLITVTIPDGVTILGSEAFSGCTNLTSITIPDSVSSIGWAAFFRCSSLTDVNIPDGVTNIASGTFWDCRNLHNITIPNSVISIGSDGDGGAFEGCSSLTSITIPASVVSMGSERSWDGWGMFAGCSSLKSLTAYSTLAEVAPPSFQDVSLDLLTYHGTRDEYYAEGNQLREALNPPPGRIIFDDDAEIPPAAGDFSYTVDEDGASIITGYRGNSSSVTIPAELDGRSVVGIGDGAFADNHTLTAVSIPSSVTIIGDSAFWNCSGLSSLDLPANVTSIGSEAFQFCRDLKTLSAYNNLTEVGLDAFDEVALDLLTYHGTRTEYYADGNPLRQALDPQPGRIVFDGDSPAPSVPVIPAADVSIEASPASPVSGQEITFEISSVMPGLNAVISTAGLSYVSSTGTGNADHVATGPASSATYTYRVTAAAGEMVTFVLLNVRMTAPDGSEVQSEPAAWRATAVEAAPSPSAPQDTQYGTLAGTPDPADTITVVSGGDNPTFRVTYTPAHGGTEELVFRWKINSIDVSDSLISVQGLSSALAAAALRELPVGPSQVSCCVERNGTAVSEPVVWTVNTISPSGELTGTPTAEDILSIEHGSSSGPYLTADYTAGSVSVSGLRFEWTINGNAISDEYIRTEPGKRSWLLPSFLAALDPGSYRISCAAYSGNAQVGQQVAWTVQITDAQNTPPALNASPPVSRSVSYYKYLPEADAQPLSASYSSGTGVFAAVPAQPEFFSWTVDGDPVDGSYVSFANGASTLSGAFVRSLPVGWHTVRCHIRLGTAAVIRTITWRAAVISNTSLSPYRLRIRGIPAAAKLRRGRGFWLYAGQNAGLYWPAGTRFAWRILSGDGSVSTTSGESTWFEPDSAGRIIVELTAWDEKDEMLDAVTYEFDVEDASGGGSPDDGQDAPTVVFRAVPDGYTGVPFTVYADLSGWQDPVLSWGAVGGGAVDPISTAMSTDGRTASASFLPMQAGQMQIFLLVQDRDDFCSADQTLEIRLSLPGGDSPGGPSGGFPSSPSAGQSGSPSTSPSLPPGDDPSAEPSKLPGSSTSASPSSGRPDAPTSSTGLASAVPSGGGSAARPTASALPLYPASSAPSRIQFVTLPGVCCPYLLGLPISSRAESYPAVTIGSYVAAQSGVSIEITTLQGSIIPAGNRTVPFSTGQKVRALQNGRVLLTTTVVVKGDVTGSGELNIAQLVRIAQACTGAMPLYGIYLYAGDFTDNGRIDISDVVRVAQMLAA